MANRAIPVSHRTKLYSAQLQLLLRPLIKAYVLGYASSTTPQLLTVLVSLITRKPRAGEDSRLKHAAIRLYEILRNSLHIQRFPAFCAAIIGGATLLKVRFLSHECLLKKYLLVMIPPQIMPPFSS